MSVCIGKRVCVFLSVSVYLRKQHVLSITEFTLCEGHMECESPMRDPRVTIVTLNGAARLEDPGVLLAQVLGLGTCTFIVFRQE